MQHTVSTNLTDPHNRQPGCGVPWAMTSRQALNLCIRPVHSRIVDAIFSDFLSFCFNCHFSIVATTSSGPAGIWSCFKSLSVKHFLYVSRARLHAITVGESFAGRGWLPDSGVWDDACVAEPISHQGRSHLLFVRVSTKEPLGY
jgi:hypothetical protein